MEPKAAKGSEDRTDGREGGAILVELMPYPDTDRTSLGTAEPAAPPRVEPPMPRLERTPAHVTADWRQRLPLLSGTGVTLRELRLSDAPSLHAMLTADEVARFTNRPPTTVEDFEKFIAWTLRERVAGNYVGFGIVPEGRDDAIGLFQVRSLKPGFGLAEWGFAIGAPFWGTGLFRTGAPLVLDFAFETMGVHRMEGRVATQNGRGNGAMRQLGVAQKTLLRRSFLRRGIWLDQFLWSILAADWQQLRPPDPRETFH